jgi:hypothetical protein
MANLSALWVAAAVFAQVALALGLLGYLGSIRIPLIMRGKVGVRDIALSRDPWPEQEKKVSNAFDNQFQLPVLFYLACGFSILMNAGVLDVVLAWAFVISRYVHAAIFITSNDVVRRFFAYAIGYGIVCAFWLLLAIRLVAVGIAFGLH